MIQDSSQHIGQQAIIGPDATDRCTDHAANVTWVKLAIPLDLLEGLMRKQTLCAADVRCLDKASKEHLARLCLKRCAACIASLPETSRKNPRSSGMSRIGESRRPFYDITSRRYEIHDP